ncbi:MAG: hypothetical protein ACTHMC_18680 [Pseudobacter sp.]|uniref:hypothetical protein n=1 Tax=Pseudobacter sp. TaxID=2045420 RepID=UPI003F7FB31F
MRQFIVVLLFSVFSSSCFSQVTEFDSSRNGLIYSDVTIKQLKSIVDSLNLKFGVCELSKTYLSKQQAKAHFVSLEKTKVREAKKDIESNISFEDFIAKYTNAKTDRELLVVKFRYKNYQDKDVVEFSNVAPGNDHKLTFDIDINQYKRPLKGKWLYTYYDKALYTQESIEAFYFTEEFTQQPMPVDYAKMIQYADCMVDTSTKVFSDKAQKTGVRYEDKTPPTVQEFMNYVHTATEKPEYPENGKEKEKDAYWEQYQIWDSLRISRIDKLQGKDPQFKTLLENAVKDALLNGGAGNEFEEYVEHYHSKKAALELKRNRIVVGGCSMDNSPRVHAFNIAILSAETTNWEVFLRSHLDIMNDRFERTSDGSYAWERRKTYIKELEVLDINVPDLLLGISLRIGNASDNHYYGNIQRLGRALAETSRSEEIETKMLKMMVDDQLDLYNRIVIYYLFQHYNYNLENGKRQAENKQKLLAAIDTFPSYLAIRAKQEKWGDHN